MAPELRRVDPTRRPSRVARAYAAVAGARPARFASRHLGWRMDPWLLRATRGRVASTLFFPAAVLEPRGARSGEVRRHAVLYFHDGERVTIVASHAGAPRHPAWYHNLCAHPDVTFGEVAMVATVVRDESERVRLWTLADRAFPTYRRYRRDAARVGRTIPIVQLERRR